MKRNTIRQGLERHMEENRLKYLILLLAFVAGLTGGALFVPAVGQDQAESLKKTVGAAFININSAGGYSVFKGFLRKNLRSVGVIALSTAGRYLLPLLHLNIAFTGASIGFTGTFICSGFGYRGFLIFLCLTLTQVLLAVPTMLFLSVAAMDFTLHNVKDRYRASKKNRIKFFLLCLIGMAALSLFSLPDCFLAPMLIRRISAGLSL